MADILGLAWINGWMAPTAQRLDFTISRVILNFGNVSFSNATSTVFTVSCITRWTLIPDFNYVHFVYTPLNMSVNLIGTNFEEQTNGARILEHARQ